jgi:hypothetical protein
VTLPALYLDDQGRSINTNSMLKCFRRCPRQALYTYHDRLKPRIASTPLKRGTWMHNLLEAYYKGEDWEAEHARQAAKFSELFDEEKEKIGDLPTECLRLMKSYLWHYGANKDDKYHGWKIHDVEMSMDWELPDGDILRGKIDLLVEDRFGLWIVDHKNMKNLPDFHSRVMDPQSAIYLWLAQKNKIPVQGFIWNYLRTKGLTVPKMLKDGSRLSMAAIDTDYLTYATAIKQYQQDYGLKITPEIKAKLIELKSQRWVPDQPQTSSFFRRDIIEKDDDMLKRVIAENWNTARRMRNYNFKQRDAVERVILSECNWMCEHKRLCMVELTGGNPQNILRQDYRVGDPMDYYDDKKDRRES